MRRLSRAKKLEPNTEVTPWLLQNESNRSEFDQNHFRSISLLHPHSQISFLKDEQPSSNIPHIIKSSIIDKCRKAHLHRKTLTYIKDYYKKNYTQECGKFLNQSIIPMKNIKEAHKKQIANFERKISKKTSIIDLTRSLTDNILQNRGKTMIMHKDKNSRDQACSRILKIKQDMIRNKQRRKIDKVQLQIWEDQLRPESKTLPMRAKSPRKTSKIRMFPERNFGHLLSQFLEKV